MNMVPLVLDDGALGLAVSGEIDVSTVQELRDALAPLVERAPERIVLDLAAVDFMDSSGLAVLVAVASKIPYLEITNAIPIVRRIVEVTGLEDVLHLSP
jgi:anti-sigma B factor antagonist